jgi:hypothetical protein
MYSDSCETLRFIKIFHDNFVAFIFKPLNFLYVGILNIQNAGIMLPPSHVVYHLYFLIFRVLLRKLFTK